MSRYASLLSPFEIKGLRLRNRVLSTAHAPGYAEHGLPGERYQAYHEEKARGGVGLSIFGGSSNVSRDSGSIYGQIYLGRDAVVPVLRDFAARIHRHGSGLMCQITHMGRRTSWDSGDWLPTKGPSALRDPAHRSMPYALSTREIARIVGDFASAARRCRDGRLDGVEVLATTHLLGQFLSPLSNRRRDDYGGELENRARFLLQVLEACRESCGEDFIIGVRFAADESNEGGLSAEQGVAIGALLGGHGVADYLNVNGAFGGSDHGLADTFPGMAFKSAPYVELARRVKRASGLPVFQAARLSDPATADWAIAEGCLDMAGMTRPLMADPQLVNKLQRGDEARIRPCVGAGYCIDRIYSGRDALCVHNVSTGREQTLPEAIPPAAQARRAVVIGGGPAGLEAARVLALRGHPVTLFEAATQLGGQLRLAARGGWRGAIIGIADWLVAEVERLGVELQLNHYASAADVLAQRPELVIDASGGLPDDSLPQGGSELLSSAWDLLAGQARLRGEVLICDEVGGHAALSLAENLAGDCQVEFVSTDRHPGRDVGGQNYPIYLRNLYRAGVAFTCGHRLLGLQREGQRLRASLWNEFSRSGVERRVDAVVLDKGSLPLGEPFAALREGSRNLGEIDHEALIAQRPQPDGANPGGDYLLFRVGDALAARNIHAALLDANRLCRAL